MAHYRCIRDCFSSAYLQYFKAGQDWEFEEGDDFPRKHFINLDEGEQQTFLSAEIPLDPTLNKKTVEWLKKKYPDSAKKVDFRTGPAKESPKRAIILQIMRDEGTLKEVPNKGFTLAEHMERERTAKLGENLING